MALPQLVPTRAAAYSPDVAVKPTMTTAPAACATCGATCDTPFCASCGERRAADRPRSLAALGEELWDAFSPVDGRIARTLWSLVRRPGELTAAYMRGARLPYVPPLRLFLIVNVLFFLHASVARTVHTWLPGVGRVRITLGGNHTFDTPLAVHLTGVRHKLTARRLVSRRVPPAAGEDSTAWITRVGRVYGPTFDAKSTTLAKSLVIAMVPMFAALVAALEWRRRRFVLQDLAFATHAMAVLLLIVVAGQYLIGIPLFVVLVRSDAHLSPSDGDLLISLGMAVPFGVWLYAGLRRAYGDGRLGALAKAALLTWGLVFVLGAYRAVLFFAAYYTT